MADDESERSSVTSTGSTSKSKSLLANLRGSRRYSKTGQQIDKTALYQHNKEGDGITKPTGKIKASAALEGLFGGKKSTLTETAPSKVKASAALEGSLRRRARARRTTT